MAIHGSGAAAVELHPARISAMLKTQIMGRSIVLCESAGSTNRVASMIAAAGAPEGTIVTADEQREGKGRKGRSWSSTRTGSLTFSVILRPERSPESLTVILALAAAAAVERACPGIEAGIKWPNDIYIGGKKAAGILAETSAGAVVLGIGINIKEPSDDLPADIAGTATSLFIESGTRPDRGRVLAGLLEELESLYKEWQNGEDAPIAEALDRRLVWKGRRAVIDKGDEVIRGTIEGITIEGFLRLMTGKEEIVFKAGDLRLEEDL